MPLSKGGSGRGEDTKRMISVVGLYCCSANHEVPFAGPGDCEVVRLYDFEENMCSLLPRKVPFGVSLFALRAPGRWLLIWSPPC